MHAARQRQRMHGARCVPAGGKAWGTERVASCCIWLERWENSRTRGRTSSPHAELGAHGNNAVHIHTQTPAVRISNMPLFFWRGGCSVADMAVALACLPAKDGKQVPHCSCSDEKPHARPCAWCRPWTALPRGPHRVTVHKRSGAGRRSNARTFAACIQFTDARTSGSAVTGANTRLVRASARARRAIAPGASSPFSGCSPIDVARPVSEPWCACAVTATSAIGS